MNIIATNSPLKDFPDVFDDKIGTLPGTAHFESGSFSHASNISDPSHQQQSQAENQERIGRSG